MIYYLFIIMFSTLAGCATAPMNDDTSKAQYASWDNSQPSALETPKIASLTEVHDSAPAGPPPKPLKNPKPTYIPLSRYGNPTTYSIAGKTYKVLPQAEGYQAQGIASWYGTKFHQKRTSSGEIYDMYALTAAHKTLPLPSYVKVKNLNNGREAIVKVNDRGPFHANRIIDLSYAAASKLGILADGTAPVEIKVISKPAPQSVKPPQYYVQAGAFESQSRAQLLQKKLQSIVSHPVFVESHENRFLVQIGPMMDINRVQEMKINLVKHGLADVFSSIR